MKMMTGRSGVSLRVKHRLLEGVEFCPGECAAVKSVVSSDNNIIMNSPEMKFPERECGVG